MKAEYKEPTQAQIDRHLIRAAKLEIKEWQKFIKIIEKEIEKAKNAKKK